MSHPDYKSSKFVKLKGLILDKQIERTLAFRNSSLVNSRINAAVYANDFEKKGYPQSAKMAIVSPLQTGKPVAIATPNRKNTPTFSKNKPIAEPNSCPPLSKRLAVEVKKTCPAHKKTCSKHGEMIQGKKISPQCTSTPVHKVSTCKMLKMTVQTNSSNCPSASAASAGPPKQDMGKFNNVIAALDVIRNKKKRKKKKKKNLEKSSPAKPQEKSPISPTKDKQLCIHKILKLKPKDPGPSPSSTLNRRDCSRIPVELLNQKVSPKVSHPVAGTAYASTPKRDSLGKVKRAHGDNLGVSRKMPCKVSPSNSEYERLSRSFASCRDRNISVNPPIERSDDHAPSSIDLPDVEMMDVSTLPMQELINMKQDANFNVDQESYYIVLDTNVLISDLKAVNQIVGTYFEGLYLPHIYIPWMVLQELDRLKVTTKNKYRAIDAVRYINSKLITNHPRFHGQSAKMAANCHKEYDECNDDAILSCCLQLHEAVNKDRVILLTNDRNLCNKALVSEIKAHSVETLMAKLRDQAKEQKDIRKSPSHTLNAAALGREMEASKLKNQKIECVAVMCEIKMMLKCFLEPFLIESMKEAFGDHMRTFLPQPPYSLGDIFGCFNKYWKSVFGCVLPNSVIEHLQQLSKLFSIDEGSYNTEVAFSTLSSVQTICIEILKVSTSCQADIDAALSRVQFLTEQCRIIFGSCAESQSMYKETSVINNQAALAVFHHIWDLINHLCGMILDFIGKPHDFKYDRPAELPSKTEYQMLVANLYPGMYKIKKEFAKIIDGKPESEATIRHLYDHLIQFIPSLQIPASQPPLEQFSIETLRHFCFDKENEQILKVGYQQLDLYFQKLNECIHDPIWKH